MTDKEYEGPSGLFGQMTPEDEAKLQRMRVKASPLAKRVENSPTVGEIRGDTVVLFDERLMQATDVAIRMCLEETDE